MANGTPVLSEQWAPNEAPKGRWVGFFFAVVGVMFASQLFFGIVTAIWKMSGPWEWLPGTLCTFLSFAVTLLVATILIRVICKTSFRDFVLGAGGKVDWKVCGKMLGAWFLGLVLNAVVSTLFFTSSDEGIQLNTIGAGPIIANIVIALVLVWTQTTTEEVIFRGSFLRATCGNNIRPTVKCLCWGFVSCIIFMLFHCMNPEVLTQTSPSFIAMALLTYFIAGAGMYLSDVVYGNLMPGCVIHWINNFFLFSFLVEANTAVQTGALFTSSASSSALSSLVGTIVLYVPIFVVLIVDWKKRKNA